MLKPVGMLLLWGFVQTGSPFLFDAGKGAVVLAAGGSMPLPSDLLTATIRMEQARQIERWQTRKFEAELKCRQYPDQCPPLIEIRPRPRPDLDFGEGRIAVEGTPADSLPLPGK